MVLLIETEKLERFSTNARIKLMSSPYFYHGTTKLYEESIRLRGLLAHSGRKNWVSLSKDDSVYFTSDKEEAKWFGKNGPMFPIRCELILVKIPADFVLSHIDELEEDAVVNNGQCFLLHVDIPPEILTIEEVERCT